jgi:hypothetical protein
MHLFLLQKPQNLQSQCFVAGQLQAGRTGKGNLQMMWRACLTGGWATLVTHGASAAVLVGPQAPDKGFCAHGMGTMAMLRVASVESPAWTWSSTDLDLLDSRAGHSMTAPSASTQGTAMQVDPLFHGLFGYFTSAK